MIGSNRNISSRLRHRLTLQQEIQASDGGGGYTRSWQDVADLWAEVISINGTAIRGAGNELPEAAQLQSHVSHRILLRYRDGVTADMRLVFENRVFNIVYVTDSGENRNMLEILAIEGVAG